MNAVLAVLSVLIIVLVLLVPRKETEKEKALRTSEPDDRFI